MFKVKNVSKQYGEEVSLKNVSFTILRGLNYIIGPSGSGKTTLLQIMSAMDSNFDGSVSYGGKELKNLSEKEKSYFYNNVFGFVWQNFNLLEELTVYENVVLPRYLKGELEEKKAFKILKEMGLSDLVDQKVKYLSGGQKQRVAITRELMKDPEVIFADEPTSALDAKTSKEVMDILKNVAKTKTVIIVTHDTSLITKNDSVLELDKGELISSFSSNEKETVLKKKKEGYFPFSSALSLAKITGKRYFGRFAVSLLTLMVAAILLLTTFSGAIHASGQDSFNKLLTTYGEGILDISIVGSFMSAEGSGGSSDKPDADVTQDIGGLFDRYNNDKRVEFTLFSQAFNNISITMDKNRYSIESSGSVPVLRRLLSGSMPDGTKKEVVVPESFVKKSGFTKETILGKEITFSSSVYNWSTGKPVLKDVLITAKIVGVADNTAAYENQGEKVEYSVDDSFFFSKLAMEEMRKQAQFQDDKMNFVLRAKTPEDMISIKDELNKEGIVPLGQFELIEDVVKLNSQTAEQSGSASAVIGVLAIFLVFAIVTITGVMRKREYAIYKVSGFSNDHLRLFHLAELLIQTLVAVCLLLLASPLINVLTMKLFQVNILSFKMLSLGVLLLLLMGIFAYLIGIVVSAKIKIGSAFKAGDR